MWIFIVLSVFVAVCALVAVVHAAVTRPDAFTAVDAQTKVFWVVALAVSTVLVCLLRAESLLSILGILYLIATVVVLVYLVDVRVRVDEIQGRSWFRKTT
ncbi:MAG: DUF2516 family protein [Gordonia sp. (in: high G+C Gram-positive bacteria)]